MRRWNKPTGDRIYRGLSSTETGRWLSNAFTTRSTANWTKSEKNAPRRSDASSAARRNSHNATALFVYTLSSSREVSGESPPKRCRCKSFGQQGAAGAGRRFAGDSSCGASMGGQLCESRAYLRGFSFLHLVPVLMGVSLRRLHLGRVPRRSDRASKP